MNKFGRRILAALITSSLVVTPVFVAPSVDDLQKSKASAQSEVNSLQSQLQSIVSKITQLEADLTTKGEEIIQAQADRNSTRLNSSHSGESRMPSSA